MAFTVDSVPDLTGRVALVTGANGGLGLETAAVFAAKGAHVIMAMRDQEKGARAMAGIREQTPTASLEAVELDLASQASVVEAAAAVRRDHDRIDILVNNAGVMANYHFGLGLQREFERAGVRAQSLIAHPGLSHSDLQTTTVAEGGGGPMAPFFAWLAARTGMEVADGAMPQIRAATDPAARGGEFYGPRFMNNGPAVRRPVLRPGRERAIATLWAVSERETGVPMVVEAG